MSKSKFIFNLSEEEINDKMEHFAQERYGISAAEVISCIESGSLPKTLDASTITMLNSLLPEKTMKKTKKSSKSLWSSTIKETKHLTKDLKVNDKKVNVTLHLSLDAVYHEMLLKRLAEGPLPWSLERHTEQLLDYEGKWGGNCNLIEIKEKLQEAEDSLADITNDVSRLINP